MFCSHCGSEVLDDGTLAGQTVACPHCGGELVMPGTISAPMSEPKRGVIVEWDEDAEDWVPADEESLKILDELNLNSHPDISGDA